MIGHEGEDVPGSLLSLKLNNEVRKHALATSAIANGAMVYVARPDGSRHERRMYEKCVKLANRAETRKQKHKIKSV